jgi:hypothetical protein
MRPTARASQRGAHPLLALPRPRKAFLVQNRRRVTWHGRLIRRGDIEVGRSRIIRGKHEGSITVLEGGDLTVDGMVTGTIRILGGGAAKIRGMSGSVEVEEGGLLLLTGVVSGRLHVHRGGRAEVSGTVASTLQQDPGSSVVRRRGARVAGGIVA